jgi:hypothetical protein
MTSVRPLPVMYVRQELRPPFGFWNDRSLSNSVEKVGVDSGGEAD